MDDIKPITSQSNDVSQTCNSEVLEKLLKTPKIVINITRNVSTDDTPTPTRFIRNCEEVGLFQDLLNVNPFEETFKKAVESSKLGLQPLQPAEIDANTENSSLHTPHIIHFTQTEAQPPRASVSPIEEPELPLNDEGLMIDLDRSSQISDLDHIDVISVSDEELGLQGPTKGIKLRNIRTYRKILPQTDQNLRDFVNNQNGSLPNSLRQCPQLKGVKDKGEKRKIMNREAQKRLRAKQRQLGLNIKIYVDSLQIQNKKLVNLNRKLQKKLDEANLLIQRHNKCQKCNKVQNVEPPPLIKLNPCHKTVTNQKKTREFIPIRPKLIYVLGNQSLNINNNNNQVNNHNSGGSNMENQLPENNSTN